MLSLLIKEFFCLINLFLDFIEHHMRSTVHFLLQVVFCFSKLNILSRLYDRNLVLLTLPLNHVNFAHYVRSLLYRLREKQIKWLLLCIKINKLHTPQLPYSFHNIIQAVFCCHELIKMHVFRTKQRHIY